MKKVTLRKKIESMYHVSMEKRDRILKVVEKFEARISGKRGAEDTRDRFFTGIEKLYKKDSKPYFTSAQRRKFFVQNAAIELAAKADLKSDEHSSWNRGDYLRVEGLDFVGHWESAKAPYWDMGGEGLGLVEVTRKRVYARSSKWGPSYVSTKFLVGRNEAGTYFSHPVSPKVDTVEEAVQWIWNGKAYQIIQRQGDIALIGGSGGPKMPKWMPTGHMIQGDIIVHETHPDLPMPQNPGERIIVGRRAAEKASEATRD